MTGVLHDVSEAVRYGDTMCDSPSRSAVESRAARALVHTEGPP